MSTQSDNQEKNIHDNYYSNLNTDIKMSGCIEGKSKEKRPS